MGWLAGLICGILDAAAVNLVIRKILDGVGERAGIYLPIPFSDHLRALLYILLTAIAGYIGEVIYKRWERHLQDKTQVDYLEHAHKPQIN